jgi:hypothetical protein
MWILKTEPFIVFGVYGNCGLPRVPRVPRVDAPSPVPQLLMVTAGYLNNPTLYNEATRSRKKPKLSKEEAAADAERVRERDRVRVNGFVEFVCEHMAHCDRCFEAPEAAGDERVHPSMEDVAHPPWSSVRFVRFYFIVDGDPELAHFGQMLCDVIASNTIRIHKAAVANNKRRANTQLGVMVAPSELHAARAIEWTRLHELLWSLNDFLDRVGAVLGRDLRRSGTLDYTAARFLDSASDAHVLKLFSPYNIITNVTTPATDGHQLDCGQLAWDNYRPCADEGGVLRFPRPMRTFRLGPDYMNSDMFQLLLNPLTQSKLCPSVIIARLSETVAADVPAMIASMESALAYDEGGEGGEEKEEASDGDFDDIWTVCVVMNTFI